VAGDLLDRGPLVAALGEQLGRGGGDQLAAGGRDNIRTYFSRDVARSTITRLIAFARTNSANFSQQAARAK